MSLYNPLNIVGIENGEKTILEECPKMKTEYNRMKIIVAGDGGVGKTSLLNRYISNDFIESMSLTVGSDFFSQACDFKEHKIKIQIWDFGGEPRFRFILPDYCIGASGVLLAFDLSDFSTLLSVKEWLQLIRGNTENPVTILVGTKADNTNLLDEEIIKEFCIQNEIDEYIPTSSKTGKNVDFVFKELIRRVIAREMSFGGVKNVEQSSRV
ncbi:Rab family GTPase [Candidatus Borrarchaeum sp.]|uniref:Rab family GTPase n=1 Tax=Candidatus Borrarchaeum sp. TaxID=2846742 RepID=UPI00257D99E2|nr:Rab family GTPase [Candidatus Borrarchaeum sp.]